MGVLGQGSNWIEKQRLKKIGASLNYKKDRKRLPWMDTGQEMTDGYR